MNERAIFLEALDQGDPALWPAFLETACSGDAPLRHRIEALLKSHLEAASFLGKLAPERVAEELAALQTGPATPGEIAENGVTNPELGFLAPSQQPGSLGRLGHYEVQEVIGHGGMGIVLRALDEKLHRVAAIKVMAAQLATNATARKRFTREAQAAAAVTHDHIVTIYAVDEAAGLPYLAMQYIAGVSLQQRIDRSGPLQLEEILRIGMQTASGLAAAHAQGLIHRDIKPANILLENGVERVKLTDFGLARAADDANLTQSGMVTGTPHYMSPEQAQGIALDQRSDLFSLGSVLYAMCTGRTPFRASGTVAVLKRVCEEIPSPVHEINAAIPTWLSAIIEKLHAKDPAERYQSAAEVAEVLGRHLAHVQHPSVMPLPQAVASAIEPDSAQQVRRSHRRGASVGTWWTVAAVLLVLLFGGLSLTEATGVTRLVPAVIRVWTPEGTLVVEMEDDPAIKVTIEGDGGLVVITGADSHEVRLKPDSYKLQAEKNGQKIPLERELVSIVKGGREVVRVKLERPQAPVVAKSEQGAFVLLAAGQERKYDTLAEAVLNSSDGDTIEIRGNGPFVNKTVRIQDRALTIRASEGFRPILRMSRNMSEGPDLLVAVNAPLIVEGLEFQRDAPRDPQAKGPKDEAAIRVFGGSLHVANCRFLLPQGNCIRIDGAARRSVLKNCEFLDSWNPLSGILGPESRWVIDNSVQAATLFVSSSLPLADQGEASIRVTRSSLAGGACMFYFYTFRPEPPKAHQTARAVRLELSGSVADAFTVLFVAHQEPLGPADSEELLARQLDWRGQENLYDVKAPTMSESAGFLRTSSPTGPNPWHGPKDLASWGKFWKSAEAGSREGRVRYQGGDLASRAATAPDKITPDEFRLRSDSAGYRAGPDGKDLGANVDLVGPGPAYERWKKTPEYEMWLKETEQQK